MRAAKRFLARLWPDEHGTSSVEYVLLLSLIGGGIIIGAEMLGSSVSNKLFEAAGWFGDAADIVANNCGSEGGAGSGGGNTCQ